MKPLTSASKKKIINQLNKQFGIKKVPYLLLQFGKEKLRLYSGSFSKQELIDLDRTLRVETIGLYFAKQQQDGLRLTIDGTQLFKSQITKNILEVNNNQAEQWFKGYDLEIQIPSNFKILKNKGYLIGCGKSTGEKITNSIPKERRVKG
jgi:NOL1/NOP2/fmu family ribosome biogenesis protein